MSLTTADRRRLGMAYQVKYDCGVRGGCGATETSTHQAPAICAHGGSKRDAPEEDARLDRVGGGMLQDFLEIDGTLP